MITLKIEKIYDKLKNLISLIPFVGIIYVFYVTFYDKSYGKSFHNNQVFVVISALIQGYSLSLLILLL